MKKYILLMVSIAFLLAAGLLVAPLRREQIRYDLTGDPVGGVGPDMVLLTTALGSFRGLIINVIWIRMERLKQEGRFFEIAQLADLACKLAPRFPKVWDFNAWNMAYNITPQLSNHRERWPWVRRGIALLRDQGIPNNPEEPELYFSLAWVYMHKIGDDIDDAHFWYKQRLGFEMHEVLRGRGSREFLEWMAAAPRTRQALLQDEERKRFYEGLVERGFDPLRVGDGGERQLFAYLRHPDIAPESATRWMEDAGHHQHMVDIAVFVRADYLRTELNLVPELMIELMDEYGPLDWRTPYAHAIYWATRGRRVAAAYRERTRRHRLRAAGHGADDIPEIEHTPWAQPGEWGYPYRYGDIDYDRIIYGSLQNLVTRGRLIFDAYGRLMPMMGPDYRFTEPMIEQFEYLLDKYGTQERLFAGIEVAYEYFLRGAVVEFFFMGSAQASEQYYQKLLERFPGPAYRVPHDRFVTAELQRFLDVAGPSDMRRIIRGMLYQSYFHLAAQADDRAESLYTRARDMVQVWNDEHDADVGDLRLFMDFAALNESALIDIFSGQVFFPGDYLEVLRSRLPSRITRRIEQAVQRAEEEQRLDPFEVE